MSVDPSGTTSYDLNRSPVSGVLFGGIALAALGLWVLLNPQPTAGALGSESDVFAQAIGGAVTVLGAAGIGAWLLLRGMKGDAVRLTPTGLSIGAGRNRLEEVPWPEVTGIAIMEVEGVEMLGVTLSDPERAFTGRDARSREQAARYAKEFGTPVLIPRPMVAARLPEVAAAIEAYQHRYGADRSG